MPGHRIRGLTPAQVSVLYQAHTRGQVVRGLKHAPTKALLELELLRVRQTVQANTHLWRGGVTTETVRVCELTDAGLAWLLEDEARYARYRAGKLKTKAARLYATVARFHADAHAMGLSWGGRGRRSS